MSKLSVVAGSEFRNFADHISDSPEIHAISKNEFANSDMTTYPALNGSAFEPAGQEFA